MLSHDSSVISCYRTSSALPANPLEAHRVSHLRALGKYPIIYRVEKLRDGKSYVTRYVEPISPIWVYLKLTFHVYSPRSVTASQHGQPIFMLTCSFTLPTPARFPQPSFREPMPLGIPPPLACESEEERWSKFLASPSAARLHPGARHSLEAYVMERESSPVAIREVPRDVEFWFEDDDASEEKRRADKVEAKWDGSVTGKANFAARARGSSLSSSPDQSVKQVKRKMERHERMLWMKAKDENVATLDTNFQKVRTSSGKLSFPADYSRCIPQFCRASWRIFPTSSLSAPRRKLPVFRRTATQSWA